MTKNKLSKLPPAWHAEAASILTRDCPLIQADLVSATRRAVVVGAFLEGIKIRGKQDGSIPHGRLGPWLEKNVPNLPRRTAGSWMNSARQAFAFAKRQPLPFSPDGQLPKEVEDIISDKTKFAGFIEWKQAKFDSDGCLVPARGRRPGEGGKEAEPTGDIAAIAEYHRKYSLRHMGIVSNELDKLALRCLHQSDDILNAWVGTLERHVKCVNAWLNEAPSRRDPKAIEKLWKTL